MLPKVWPAMDFMHVNTVEMPVYWEQVEAIKGKYDFSVVDTLLIQARTNEKRLILLWFATWKNGNPHYVPEWMKLDTKRFPRVIDEKLFKSPVPENVIKAMHVQSPETMPTWEQAFGKDADVCFHNWAVAKYIGKVAEAGKAVYPLPLFVNAAPGTDHGAALRDSTKAYGKASYEDGGPSENILPIWKVAAPAIKMLSPDNYAEDAAGYLRCLKTYQRDENQFIVSGFYCRVDFSPAKSEQKRNFIRVEEGNYENGEFKFKRLLNGDQTDGGLDFSSEPLVMRVTLYRYE
jgi:beta-galactosidase GanA